MMQNFNMPLTQNGDGSSGTLPLRASQQYTTPLQTNPAQQPSLANQNGPPMLQRAAPLPQQPVNLPHVWNNHIHGQNDGSIQGLACLVQPKIQFNITSPQSIAQYQQDPRFRLSSQQAQIRQHDAFRQQVTNPQGALQSQMRQQPFNLLEWQQQQHLQQWYERQRQQQHQWRLSQQQQRSQQWQQQHQQQQRLQQQLQHQQQQQQQQQPEIIVISDDEDEQKETPRSSPHTPQTPDTPASPPATRPRVRKDVSRWYKSTCSMALATAMDSRKLPQRLMAEGKTEELESMIENDREQRLAEIRGHKQELKRIRTEKKEQAATTKAAEAPKEKEKKRKREDAPAAVSEPDAEAERASRRAEIAARRQEALAKRQAEQKWYTEEMGSDVLPDRNQAEDTLPPPSKAAIQRCSIAFPLDPSKWKPTKIGFGEIWAKARLSNLKSWPEKHPEHEKVLRDEAYWGVDCRNCIFFPPEAIQSEEKAENDLEDLFAEDGDEDEGVRKDEAADKAEPEAEFALVEEKEQSNTPSDRWDLVIEQDEPLLEDSLLDCLDQEASPVLEDSESKVSEEE